MIYLGLVFDIEVKKFTILSPISVSNPNFLADAHIEGNSDGSHVWGPVHQCARTGLDPEHLA